LVHGQSFDLEAGAITRDGAGNEMLGDLAAWDTYVEG